MLISRIAAELRRQHGRPRHIQRSLRRLHLRRFVGNVVLKLTGAGRRAVPNDHSRNRAGKRGLPAISAIVDRIWRRRLHQYGGAASLNGVAIICHGRSDQRAIASAIRVARSRLGGASRHDCVQFVQPRPRVQMKVDWEVEVAGTGFALSVSSRARNSPAHRYERRVDRSADRMQRVSRARRKHADVCRRRGAHSLAGPNGPPSWT